MRTKKVKVRKVTRTTKFKAVKKPYKMLPMKMRTSQRKPKVIYTDADLYEAIVKVNKIAKARKAGLFCGGDPRPHGQVTGFVIKL